MRKGKYQVTKTYAEINHKIKSGDVVVVTAEEMIDIVREEGEVEAARHVDVVTTGTFAPMCSSGAFINFGHAVPTIKASKVWLNNVPAYAGIAAVDCYLGVTETTDDDPLNRVYPGEFRYGGGHVIQDLVAGKKIFLRAQGYGTDCYPRTSLEKEITLKTLPYAVLFNPRNAYQNYNCAVNASNKTIYTYMGTLKPRLANANFCSAGQLSPLFNDPFYQTIGIGTRIFLGGGIGYVTGAGTQHKPGAKRSSRGIPLTPAGTLSVTGDLKTMSARWLVGASIQGYGCSLSVGLGLPIPILNEQMAAYTAVSNEDLFTQVVDYSHDYAQGTGKTLGQVSYADLFEGQITLDGQTIPAFPLSSMMRAREIAQLLKDWILKRKFFLGEPQDTLPAS